MLQQFFDISGNMPACSVNTAFLSIDEKHRIKVGEPNFPVAAAEWGRQVVVSMNTFCLVIAVPKKVSDSSYRGRVSVGVKDSIFQPSSPICHTTEITDILSKCYSKVLPMLFVYSDGGPDHGLTYVSVQISLIALYLYHDLDYLCVARTAPCLSWRNPVERVMLLNLGLHCVGPMRKEMPTQY